MMETENLNDQSFGSSFSSCHGDAAALVIKAPQVQQLQKQQQPTTTASKSLLRSFASTLRPHEWLLGFGALIAMYLVNGAFAPTVCALATSLPAVVHSYRVITEEKDNLTAHQVTLCYWILLGFMTIFDVFLGNAFCYYFAKFILMSSVYAHVVAKSRNASSSADAQMSPGRILTEGLLSSAATSVVAATPPPAAAETEEVTASTQQPTMQQHASSQIQPAGSLALKHGSFASYLPWTKKKEDPVSSVQSVTPTPTTGSNISSSEAFSSPTPTDFSVHESDDAKLPSSSKVKESKNLAHPGGDAESLVTTFSAAPSNFAEMLQTDTPISTFQEASINSSTVDDSNLFRRRHASKPQQSYVRTSPASTDWSRTFSPIASSSTRQSAAAAAFYQRFSSPRSASSFKDSSAVETLPCFEDDLASDPIRTITFASPFLSSANLSITNVTTNKIMWALKTNALDRIIATPTCGFLAPGNTLRIKMAVREGSKVYPEDSGRDRMAIDYAFVPQSCVTFDPAHIVSKNADARRKSFNINYAF